MDVTEDGMNCLQFLDTAIKTEPPDDYPDPAFSTSSSDLGIYSAYADASYTTEDNPEYNYEYYHSQHIKEEPEADPHYGNSAMMVHFPSAEMQEVAQNLNQIKAEPEELESSCSTEHQCSPCPLAFSAMEDQDCDAEMTDGRHVIVLPDNSTVFVNPIEDSNDGMSHLSDETAVLTDNPSTDSLEMVTPIIVDVQGNFSFHDFKNHVDTLEGVEENSPLPGTSEESSLHPGDDDKMRIPMPPFSGCPPFDGSQDAELDLSCISSSSGQNEEADTPGDVENYSNMSSIKEHSWSRSRKRKMDSSHHLEVTCTTGGTNKRRNPPPKILRVRRNGVEEYFCYPSDPGKVCYKKCLHCPDQVESGKLLAHYLECHGIDSFDVTQDQEKKPLAVHVKEEDEKERDQLGVSSEVGHQATVSPLSLEKGRDKFEETLRESLAWQHAKDLKTLQHLENVKEECLAITIGNKMRYRCVMCPEEYSAVGIFYHAKTHAKDLSDVCKGCREEIQSVNCLRRHIQTCQDKLEVDTTSFKCVVCLADCGEGIFFHATLHQQELPKVCAGCNQSLCSVFDVRQHCRHCQARLNMPTCNGKSTAEKKPAAKCLPRILRRGMSPKSLNKQSTLGAPSGPHSDEKRKNEKAHKQPLAATASTVLASSREDKLQLTSAPTTKTPNSSKKSSGKSRSRRSAQPLQSIPGIVVDVDCEEENCFEAETSTAVEQVRQHPRKTPSSSSRSHTRKRNRTGGETSSPSKPEADIQTPKLYKGPSVCEGGGPVTRRRSSRTCKR